MIISYDLKFLKLRLRQVVILQNASNIVLQNNVGWYFALCSNEGQRSKRQPSHSLRRSAYLHQPYVDTLYTTASPMQTKTSSQRDEYSIDVSLKWRRSSAHVHVQARDRTRVTAGGGAWWLPRRPECLNTFYPKCHLMTSASEDETLPGAHCIFII